MLTRLCRGLIVLGLLAGLSPHLSRAQTAEPDAAVSVTAELVSETRDRWIFEGAAGDTVTIRLTSPVFDTYLEVYDLNNNLIADNDDFPGAGRNSQVDVTLPGDSTYTIVVRGYYADAAGVYDLTLTGADGPLIPAAPVGVESGTPAPDEVEIVLTPTQPPTLPPALIGTPTVPPTAPPAVATLPVPTLTRPPAASSFALPLDRPGTIVPGTVANAELTEGGAHRWRFQGRAGDVIVILLNSTAFDPLLELYAPDGGLVADNDDANGRNAQITTTLPADGAYTIVVRRFFPDSLGVYTLVLAEADIVALAPPIPPTPVVIAPTVPPTPVPTVQQFVCFVFADNDINMRGGPGTGFVDRGTMPAGSSMGAVGQMISPMGFIWYQLADGLWVRADVVRTQGDCNSLRTLPVGGTAAVNVLDDGLRVRTEPRINAQVVDVVPNRTLVGVVSGPVTAGGFVWWQIRTPRGVTGWAVEQAGGIITLLPQVD